MSVLSEASLSLCRCERELQELGAQALKNGDYEAARRVAELAEAIADHRVKSGLDAMRAAPASSIDGDETAKTDSATSEVSGNKSGTSKRKPRDGYPRFARRGDKLIKTGWSKKNKSEYEHASPQTSVFAFAAHLCSHTRPGRMFTVETLMPVPDPESHSEIPGYQIYMALGWFREIGAIEKHGRDGYVANKDMLAAEQLGQRWVSLPTRDR